MRIVMGIKEYETGQAMVEHLQQLQFRDPEVLLLHVVEPPGGSFGKLLLTASEGEYIAQYMNNQDMLAHTMGNAICDAMRQVGIKAELQVLEGSPGELILEMSLGQKADLIMLHLEPKGVVEGLFSARVARKLLMEASSSLLIHRAQTQIRPQRNKAVFATDHSPYAQQCLERLIALAPKGLRHITVMSAYQAELLRALGPLVSQIQVDMRRWVEDKLHEENQKVIQKLEEAGWRSSSEVRQGGVHEAIAASMAQNEADLLILGAQGHGFVQRLTMGSVSLHETLYGLYPILLLRLPPEAKL